MVLLLIEDDAFKASRVRSFLGQRFPGCSVIIERSVSAGLERLIAKPMPDVVLLDMSLSTFDVGPRETGGRPQNFGGIAILEHMARRNIDLPVVLITQFPVFPKNGRDVSLDEEFRADLESRFPTSFKGLIYYNSRETDWERSLEEFLKRVHPE